MWGFCLCGSLCSRMPALNIEPLKQPHTPSCIPPSKKSVAFFLRSGHLTLHEAFTHVLPAFSHLPMLSDHFFKWFQWVASKSEDSMVEASQLLLLPTPKLCEQYSYRWGLAGVPGRCNAVSIAKLLIPCFTVSFIVYHLKLGRKGKDSSFHCTKWQPKIKRRGGKSL